MNGGAVSMIASSAPPLRAASSTRATARCVSRDHDRLVSLSEIAPESGRTLRVKVDHHRAAARELMCDGEADREGGLAVATLL